MNVDCFIQTLPPFCTLACLICTLLQTSHDRNIKTSHYPQHSCTVRSPCFLWIIKNRHITLQGWKSGGMLQMLLSKTVTSGVCFFFFFFIRKENFYCLHLFRQSGVCVCTSRHDGGEGQSVRACLMWAVGLARWLGCDWRTVWVKPSSNQARQRSLSPSPSLPGVTGWDIKTGILINCATLPPAALNMLRPRQAVCYISDSLVLFQLDLAHLSLTFTTLFPSLSPLQFPNRPHSRHLSHPSHSFLSPVHPSAVWP